MTIEEVKSRFQKWMDSVSDDAQEMIYVSTSGAVGTAIYLKFRSTERLFREAEKSIQDKEALKLEKIKIIDIITGGQTWIWRQILKTPGVKETTKLTVKSGPLAMLIVTSAELADMSMLEREAYYLAVAFAVAGWVYWLQKNPQVIEKAIETVGVVATATADVLEELFDWMPF